MYSFDEIMRVGSNSDFWDKWVFLFDEEHYKILIDNQSEPRREGGIVFEKFRLELELLCSIPHFYTFP